MQSSTARPRKVVINFIIVSINFISQDMKIKIIRHQLLILAVASLATACGSQQRYVQATISDIEPGEFEVSIQEGVEIERAELELQVPNIGEIDIDLGRVIADFPHLKRDLLDLQAKNDNQYDGRERERIKQIDRRLEGKLECDWDLKEQVPRCTSNGKTIVYRRSFSRGN